MHICFRARPLLALVFLAASLPLPLTYLDCSGGGLLSTPAQAQSRVRNLIGRLRGKTMPEGIVKTNGRIEATPGRRRGEISRPAGRHHRRGRQRGPSRAGRRPSIVAGIRGPAAGGAIQRGARQTDDGRGGGAHRSAQCCSGGGQIRLRTRRGARWPECDYYSRQTFDQRRRNYEGADAGVQGATAQRAASRRRHQELRRRGRTHRGGIARPDSGFAQNGTSTIPARSQRRSRSLPAARS